MSLLYGFLDTHLAKHVLTIWQLFGNALRFIEFFEAGIAKFLLLIVLFLRIVITMSS